MSWNYEGPGGKVLGPVNSDELARQFRIGVIDGVTKVQSTNEDTWKSFGECEQLRALVAATVDEGDGEDDSRASGATQPDKSSTVAEQWFYAEVGGSSSGPAPTDAFASLVAAGYVSGETLVWTSGMGSWCPLASVPSLSRFLGHTRTGESSRGSGRGQGEATQRSSNAAGEAPGSVQSGKRPRPADPEAPSSERSSKRKGGGGGSKSNTWVYVTGLPGDVTVEELEAHFKRAGVLRIDADTSGPRIKIYRHASPAQVSAEAGAGMLALPPCKGDASICFVMPESVELAVELLDDVALREPSSVSTAAAAGWPLHVEQAHFESKDVGGREGGKGTGKGSRKGGKSSGSSGGGPSNGLTLAQRAARIRVMEQAVRMSWADEGEDAAPLPVGIGGGGAASKGGADLRIVVLRGMFDPSEALTRPGGQEAFMAELREDVGTELETSCGDIDKMTVFPKHSEGVIVVKFKTAGAAARCLSGLDGRYYAGRRVSVGFWDGVSDYSHHENAAETQARIDDFGAWLEGEGEEEEEAQ